MTKYETYSQEALDEEVDVLPHGVADTREIKAEIQRRMKNGLPPDFAIMRSLERAPSTDDDMVAYVQAVLEANPRRNAAVTVPSAPPPRATPPRTAQGAARAPLQPTASSRLNRQRALAPFQASDFAGAPYNIIADIPELGLCAALTADTSRRVFVFGTVALAAAVVLVSGK